MPESHEATPEISIDEACHPPERVWSIQFKLQQQFPPEALQKIAEGVTAIVIYMLQNGFDLSRLDGFTVAEEYGAALAEVERGFTPTRELSFTCDEFATGVAMAVPVMRDGCHMAHVVFHLHALAGFCSEDDESIGLSQYMVAHELGHVHDVAVSRRCMPWFGPGYAIEGQLEGYLLTTAIACWEEYIACRISGHINPLQVEALERVFVDRLNALTPRVTELRTDFVRTKDVGPAWQEAAILAGNVLKHAAYLVGHIEGAAQDISESAPEAMTAIEAASFRPHMDALRAALETMRQTYGAWSDLSAYEPLKAVILAFIRSLGFDPTPQSDGGLWVVIQYPDQLTALDVMRLKMEGALGRARRAASA